jgi:subtilisin family serine protease
VPALAVVAACLAWVPAAGATPLVVGVDHAPSGSALRAAGARPDQAVTGARAIRVTTPAGDAAAVAQRVSELPGVRYVEPVYRYRPSGLPDDALLPRQWELVRSPAMGAPSAWRRGPVAPVTVAVVDTGVDVTHPDLAQNLWTNPGEIPGNGRDDDGDGLVDDVHGWNFAGDSPDVSDSAGHGTSVAGVIAARGDNRIGIAGVAWSAKVMALKVVGPDDNAGADDVAAAISYAVAHGARIVNVSLNGPDRSAAIEDSVRAAEAAGVIVIASAGNDGSDLDSAPSYPASYPEANVVGVGATGRTGSVAPFSNRGSAVDVYAPGEDILSTENHGDYGVRSGTSLAAPHVAGTLALLAGARPDLPASALRDALRRGSRRRGNVAGLDAGATLDAVLPALAPLRVTHLRASRRDRHGRVVLRWRAPRGIAAVSAYVVRIAGRRIVVRGRAGRAPRTSVRVRSRRDIPRFRVSVVS